MNQSEYYYELNKHNSPAEPPYKEDSVNDLEVTIIYRVYAPGSIEEYKDFHSPSAAIAHKNIYGGFIWRLYPDGSRTRWI